jgi:hypothetical protein
LRPSATTLSKAAFDARPQVGAAIIELMERHGRYPTDKEVVDHTGFTYATVFALRHAYVVGQDMAMVDNSNIRDTITCHEPTPEITGLVDAVRAALAELPPRQVVVLSRYYGLDGAPAQTMAEIGVTTGFGREPVRKLINRGKEALSTALAPVAAALAG